MNSLRGILAGVGCDTESCRRLRELLEHNGRFLERWFTAHERATFLDPSTEPADLASQATLLFTLKEAAIKALWNHRHLLPDAIEVYSLEPVGPEPAHAGLRLPLHGDLPIHLEATFIPVPDGWESSVLAYEHPATTEYTDHTESPHVHQSPAIPE